MTWSIVARDPASGALGIAVATKFFAVGARVTVETKSSVRCVRNSQPSAASGKMLLREVSP